MKRILIAMLLVGICSAVQGSPYRIEVSGAGTTNVNGSYVAVENPVTASLCWNKGSCYILRGRSAWVLTFNESTQYNVIDASTIPPESGWLKVYGDYPVPTLTYVYPKYVLPTRTDLGIMIPTHSLPYATYTNTTTWLTGQGTETNLYDFSPEHDDPVYVDNPCLTFDGTDYISTPGLSEYAPVVNSGTATLEVPRVANELHFTAGTCWDIRVSTDVDWPCQERFGLTLYGVDSFYPSATLVTTDLEAIRTDNTQDDSSYFAEHGGSKVLSFNGSTAFVEGTYPITGDIYPFAVSGRMKGSGGYRTVFSVAKTTTQNEYIALWGLGGKLVVNRRSGAQNLTTLSNASMFDGEWHAFRVDFLADDLVKVYIDDLDNADIVITENYNTPSLSSYAIGRNNDSTPSQYYFGVIQDISLSSPFLSFTFESKNAYGTTLPDSTGTNDATLVNTEFVYIPALLDGADDAEGLGITNPGGVVHNEGFYSISNSVMGAVTYADLITNAVYNATTNASGAVMEVYIEN